jgi:uncharacterized protein (DUF362 family)
MMMDHGPRSNNLKDIALGKFMLLAVDPVAADVAAAKLLRFDEKSIRYLTEAARRKLGEADLTKLNIQRIEM